MSILIASCPSCGCDLGNLLLVNRQLHPLRCLNPECLRPTAALEILSDAETEHVLVLERGSYSVRHPLIERLPRPGEDEPALLSCDVGAWVAEFGQVMPSMGPWEFGKTYRVWMDYDPTPGPENGTTLEGEELT